MKARIIAFYLPQYHPTPENNKYWGEGFTEWTNVGKAKPLFKGHHQPHVPADLGYYDLRMPEIREKQAELAKMAGVEGFCYWHYWFGGGKQFLQNIFDEVVETGRPDFPFCVGWANHSWNNKNWVNTKTREKDCIIAEQTYPGRQDYINHFYSLLKAFKDDRYIKVDGKLLFVIYEPLKIPNPKEFFDLWNELAKNEGLLGFHFVGIQNNAEISFLKQRTNKDKELIIPASTLFSRIINLGFDAVNSRGMILAHSRYNKSFISKLKLYARAIMLKLFDTQFLAKYDYKKVSQLLFTEEDRMDNVYPTIIPNWDRSPRAGKRAVIWYNYNPKYFKEQCKMALNLVKEKKDEHKLIFLMSWNEWGEGNYMEPDLEYGHGYINALKEALDGK